MFIKAHNASRLFGELWYNLVEPMLKKVFSKQNRALLAELVRTDFKLRYQGSVLGYAWSLLKPLLMFAILYVVFVHFLKIGSNIPHYPIYLLLGIVLWNFFAEMTGQSLISVVGRGDLIRKINIPRWMIVASASISAVINLCLNLIIVGIFMALNQVDLSWRIVLLPISLVELYVFALGVSLFLAAAFVKFRDLSNVWDVFLQAGFYVTPIFYPLSMIANDFIRKLLLTNPVAQVAQDVRYNVVTTQTITAGELLHGWKMLIPYLLVITVFLFGIRYFRKESKYFAENL